MKAVYWMIIIGAFLLMNLHGAVSGAYVIMAGYADTMTYVWFAFSVGLSIWMGHSLIYRAIPNYRIEQEMKHWRDR